MIHLASSGSPGWGRVLSHPGGWGPVRRRSSLLAGSPCHYRRVPVPVLVPVIAVVGVLVLVVVWSLILVLG